MVAVAPSVQVAQSGGAGQSRPAVQGRDGDVRSLWGWGAGTRAAGVLHQD